MVILLEGGYSMQGLSEGVCESFHALLGRLPIHAHDAEVPPEPVQDAEGALAGVKALHGL
jgi:acetoin utilization deacetylase AcuC-like enzyme